MLWKCEKCTSFSFPEGDEDENVSWDCYNDNVIVIALNFVRKYKCKYYQKIKYEQLLKECRNHVSTFSSISFYYRDKRTRIMPAYKPQQIWRDLEHYFELRDYLFNEVRKRNCSFACFQGSFRDYKADCSICIDNEDLDELKRAKGSYIPKFATNENKKTDRIRGV